MSDEDVTAAADLSIIDQVESTIEATDEDISGAKDQARAEADAANTRRMGVDRSVIAWTIIGTYAFVVIAMIASIINRFPGCDAETIITAEQNGEAVAAVVEACATAMDERSDILINAITTAVLPIVTLMLGFYFGVEKSQQSASESPPQ